MKPFSVSDIPLRGRNLVDASAGTGKTYAIATLFVRLLLETEHEPSQLLVVTFTEAATAELRDRVRARIREALEIALGQTSGRDAVLVELIGRAGNRDRVVRRLRGALNDFDNVEISTIHGFCQRTLMERAFQSDVTFDSELYGDARPLIDDLILDYWATHAGPAPLELIAYMRSEGSKFTLELARRLAHAVLRAPQAEILPREPPPESVLDLEGFRRELARAREAWQSNDMAALIAESSVRKQSYNRAHTPRWIGEMDAFFAAPPSPFLALPKCFERFCSARLREAGGGVLAEHAVVQACDGLLTAWERLERSLRAEALRFKLRLLAFLREELPRRTLELRTLSFDDLLQRLHAALHADGGAELALGIRERYPAALIDEFQDTDPLQLGIFERIYDAPNTSLFLIGDPKQAIYSFRGADVFSYVAARSRTARDRHYTMTTNYRSDPSMVAAVNHVFSTCPEPFLLSEIGYRQVSARPTAEDVLIDAGGSPLSGLEILFAESAEGPDGPSLTQDWVVRELPALVADEICATLRSGASCKGEALRPGDLAVLTRTNDQAFQIQAALRTRGVVSVVLGDKSVYASAEARDLERVLAAVIEPTSTRLVRAALATELMGVTAAELLRMDEQEGEWEAWLGTFYELGSVWMHTGFVHMCRVWMSRCKVQERLLALGDGERRMTNLLQLIELLHAASMRGHLGPSGLFNVLARERRREIVGVEAEAAQIRLESDAEAVKITTMHKSKGLEYPVVYCPYLWHGMLLHQNDEQTPKLHAESGKLIIDIGSDEREAHLARARFESLAENLRLAYVALTRARHRCTVVWGRVGRSFATSALGYLLHPPPEGPEPLDVARIQNHLSSLDDEALLASLERHAAVAPIRVRRLHGAAGGEPFRASAAPAERTLLPRRPERRVDDRFRTSSFSALTSHAPLIAAEEQQVKDHDATSVERHEPERATSALRLSAFPRGTQAGSFFHDILEHYDFTSPRPLALQALVREKLAAHRYPVELWEQAVCEQILAVLDTELVGASPTERLKLAEVPLGQRLTELEFCVPVGGRQRLRANVGLDAASLARVFRDHPSRAVPASYAESVARLGFVPLSGYLRGFIDLVVQHEGRYYVIDYKANHLGDHAEHYAPAALGHAMQHGQYFLQYHLYALAVHRYLARRVPGYSYDRHFGGAFYLFIKGMGPEHGSSGVFFEKPPLGRLEALSALLGAVEVAA